MYLCVCVCVCVCACPDLNDNTGNDPERRFTAVTLILTQKRSPFVSVVPVLSLIMFIRVPGVIAL